jgi:hypothetical protein
MEFLVAVIALLDAITLQEALPRAFSSACP